MSQTIEWRGPSGIGQTIRLFAYANDTLMEAAAGTEATNRKGLFVATLSSNATGLHTAHVVRTTDSALLAVWDVDLQGEDQHSRCCDLPQPVANYQVGEGNDLDPAAIADELHQRLTGQVLSLITDYDPETERLTITAGDAFTRQLEKASWPDLTTATSITFTCRDSGDEVRISADCTALSASRFELSLTPAETRIAARSDYVWDVEAVFSATDVKTLCGPEAPLTIRQDQTR